MSAEAFQAFAEGHTLHFTLDGQPFGAEQYFPGGRSLWRFEDGTCEQGRWCGEGRLICFAYNDGDPDAGPQCWNFRGDAESFSAASVRDGKETGFVLDFSHADDTPLDCPVPYVGS